MDVIKDIKCENHFVSVQEDLFKMLGVVAIFSGLLAWAAARFLIKSVFGGEPSIDAMDHIYISVSLAILYLLEKISDNLKD